MSAAAAAPENAHSRRSATTTIHPVPAGSPPSAAMSPDGGTYREVKQFRKWVPWLIPLFVVVNTVMFVITMYVNNCPKHLDSSCVARFLGRFSFQPFKENPLLGPSSSALQKMGALEVDKVVHGNQGWRLVTCMWLHGGVFHLLANMLSLLVIGLRLEQEFGFVRIGLLYIISGFGGSLLSALFIQSNISVGASGALFGLLGGMLSELITNWTIYANKVAALVTLVVIIVINLAVGILPHVDNFAHIGGFFSGFLLGFVFLIRPQYGWVSQRYIPVGASPRPPKPKFMVYQCVLWVLSLILLIIGFTVGLVLLFRGEDLNDHCSWCHYLSCVPTSRWSCNNKPVSCQAEQLGSQYTLSCSNSTSQLLQRFRPIRIGAAAPTVLRRLRPSPAADTGDCCFFSDIGTLNLAIMLTIGFLTLIAIRIIYIIHRSSKPLYGKPPGPLSTLIVLGSGGHTAEMINLLNVMEMDRFKPRYYVAAATDNMSLQKARVLEDSLKDKAEGELVGVSHFMQIYRSREVGQSYVTSVGTTLVALSHALWLMIKIRPHVILCNGPGTCIPLCVIAFFFKVFGIRWSSIFYVESIARVKRLSLSGLLLYKLQMADQLFVQWPQLKSKYPQANYVGRLM